MTRLCPLYKEGREIAEERRPRDANMGLWFDKFASGWTVQGAKWEFDAPNSGTSWLSAQKGAVGDKVLLQEAARRQADLARSRSGLVLFLKNSSRFAAGLGRNHPLENGLIWHPTLGTPYLPGSSVKGVLRAWQREAQGERAKWDGKNYSYRMPEHILSCFGDQDSVGDLIFLDLIPRNVVQLVPDVMTPHYGDYYQTKDVPGDWLSPVPIQFLTVEVGCEWQLCILPRTEKSVEVLQDFSEVVEEAFVWAGAGAKTAVGYGRFERCKDLEQRAQQAEAKRQQEREAQAKRSEELAVLPDDVRQLEEKAGTEGWFSKEDRGAVKEALREFLKERTELSKEAASWWKDKVFEQYNPGMWANPTGKKWQKQKGKKDWADLALQLKKLSGVN